MLNSPSLTLSVKAFYSVRVNSSVGLALSLLSRTATVVSRVATSTQLFAPLPLLCVFGRWSVRGLEVGGLGLRRSYAE